MERTAFNLSWNDEDLISCKQAVEIMLGNCKITISSILALHREGMFGNLNTPEVINDWFMEVERHNAEELKDSDAEDYNPDYDATLEHNIDKLFSSITK